MVNRDLIDLLAEFNAQGVEYLVVGAHALAVHGHVRATKDLDVWVRADAANAPRVFEALVAFGAPLQDLTVADLAEPGLVFQIGVPPLRVDVITAIDGVEFPAAWVDRVQVSLDGTSVSVISRHHLIENKRASGRLQDLADVERLEAGDV
ncbi:MAG: nucleotidyltransferase [bacterium]|nr:nucleotidyltransferase [bacterium]